MTTLSTCTTLRASFLQTMQFVYYHLNNGVDRMYLFFDDPQDPAVEALAPERRAVCIRCDEAHWRGVTSLPRKDLSLNTMQRLNTSLAISYARTDGCDWLAHMDSDELIYSPSGIKVALSKAPAGTQLLKLTTLESVPDPLSATQGFPSAKNFKVVHPTRPGKNKNRDNFQLSLGDTVKYFAAKFIYQQKSMLARLLGARRAYKSSYIKGHVSGKSIIRTNANVNSMDCHYPIVDGTPLKMFLFSNSYILHFDAPTYENWKQKWLARYDGPARANAKQELRLERLWQYERFVELYRRGDESELKNFYEDLFYLQPQETLILNKLGLLRQINLRDALFERTSPAGDD